jgi:phenylpropionate dioxygenase-like ring-hydroxylating dioxygenase large terminal subunit
MIPNQWYVLMDSRQVKTKPVGVTRMGEKLVFWRDGAGQVSCLRDKCPHRGVALSKGQVTDGTLECPFHGFRYDPSGRAVLIPAHGRNAPVPKAFRAHSYPTYEAEGFIWVWWGADPPKDLVPPRFFDDMDGGFTYKSVRDPWQAHYSRVIENQLDVVHLPFIHHNTIGRGGRTVVDGPAIEWVDEEHTLLYLRFYQRFLTVPVLRDLVTWAAMPFNVVVAHQDRRVVETHQPQPSGLRIGEKMIPGDRPIIEYRRRREQLIEASQEASTP